MKTVWILLWCADSCLRGGVFVEGPQDWLHQYMRDGSRLCFPGECNSAKTCDRARGDYLDKAHDAKRFAKAFCIEEPANGKFDYDTE